MKNILLIFLLSQLSLTLPLLAPAQNKILVFQSDFGLKDGAVSAMKGVAVNVSPNLKIYDLTHEIPPYNIWEASYRLQQTAPYWPAGTVFVSIVDPGVGSSRKSVVLKTLSGHYIVTPDNGTLTLISKSLGIGEVREIDETKNRRKGSGKSYTFHGRDVYAYIGARLAAGVISFEQVGPLLPKQVVQIDYQSPVFDKGTIHGNIPILDIQYGNVWTNIGDSLFNRLSLHFGDSISVRINKGNERVYEGTMPYVQTFSAVPLSESLCYINSLMDLSFALNVLAGEERHHRSEAMLSSVLNTAPQAVFWKDRQSVYLGCNAVFARVAGLGHPDEIVGKSDFDLSWNRGEAEKYRADDQAVMQSGEARLHIVEQIHVFGGGQRWIDTSKHPLRDGAGQVYGILGVFDDITDRKQTDDALRASLADLKEAQRVAHVGSWRLNLATGRTVWTEEVYRMVGLDPSSPPPALAAHQRFFTPKSWLKVQAALKRIRTSDARYGIELEVIRTDGDRRWMLLRGEPERNEHGTLVALHGMVQDITEQKLAAENLRAGERRFRLQGAALEATINAVVITDPKGNIEWVNPAFTRVTGYTLAEVVGRNPRILRSGEQPRSYYAEMWRTISSGKSWSGEFVNVRKDGGLFAEEVTITPVLDENGAISHYVAVKQDITEKRTLQKQLIETQRLESIGLLASGIAHDLNNIIAPISLSMELLRTKYPGEQRTLEMVEQCARRGADIVRQVLTFSRGMDGTRVPLRLSRLVKEMGHLMDETLPRNIELTYDVAVKEDTVRVDPTQIHQVILNLAVNARDAMPKGGKLTFKLTNETVLEGGSHRAVGAQPGEYVVVAVSDTGTGIPPEVLPRIFEPFFTTKPRGQGTGLGLSTVHGIVRGHGGFIQVQSVLGAGTTFKVYLPLVIQAEAAVKAASVAPFATGEGRLVLIADDESTIRDTTKDVLEGRGFKVLLAEDGIQAVNLFRAHRHEVKHVLLDRMMPGLSGEAAARTIHQLEPKVPIIMATGLVTEENLNEQAAELKAAGITGVLRKPFSEAQLLRLLAP